MTCAKAYNIPGILTGGFCPAVPDSGRASARGLWQRGLTSRGLCPGFISVSRATQRVWCTAERRLLSYNVGPMRCGHALAAYDFLTYRDRRLW